MVKPEHKKLIKWICLITLSTILGSILIYFCFIKKDDASDESIKGECKKIQRNQEKVIKEKDDNLFDDLSLEGIKKNVDTVFLKGMDSISLAEFIRGRLVMLMDRLGVAFGVDPNAGNQS